jgi:hypothetical protein
MHNSADSRFSAAPWISFPELLSVRPRVVVLTLLAVHVLYIRSVGVSWNMCHNLLLLISPVAENTLRIPAKTMTSDDSSVDIPFRWAAGLMRYISGANGSWLQGLLRADIYETDHTIQIKENIRRYPLHQERICGRNTVWRIR